MMYFFLRRDKGVVTSVRNQKNCGACWAVSAVEVIESVYAIKTGVLQTLSVQEVSVSLNCVFIVSVNEDNWPIKTYESSKKLGLEKVFGDILFII